MAKGYGRYKKSTKKKNILLVILALCTATIAYAYLSASFAINGTALINRSTWNIYFDNLQITEGSVATATGGRSPQVPEGSTSTTTLEWDVVLTEPGEFYEFTVDVVNAGSYDAQIDTVNIEPSLTSNERKLLEYRVLYVSTDSILNKNDLLEHDSSLKIKVRVAVKTELEQEDLDRFPSGIQKNMKIEIKYIQADGRQRPIGINVTQLLAKANPLSVTNYKDGNTSEMYTFEQAETTQLAATTDYRYIGETHCSYDNGAYMVPQRAGGDCASLYRKDSSGTITYEASCTEESGVTCTLIPGALKEIKNYIKYNGDETWRIIGVFDNKIKIIRDEAIGKLPLDAKTNGFGSSVYNGGSNDWSDAQMMYFLNQGNYGPTTYSKIGNYIYDDKSTPNLIYELGKKPASIISGTYTGESLAWKLNDKAWNQAAETVYYLGANSGAYGTSTVRKYFTERGTQRAGTQSSRPLSWTGKVGLMYPSDYGFVYGKGVNSTCYDDLKLCSNSTANKQAMSWLYKRQVQQWTISPHSDPNGQTSYTWLVDTNGNVYGYFVNVDNAMEVRPVVYLKSTTIISGTGSKSNPYKITS